MTKQMILHKFQNLPAEVQQQVLDYIDFLTEKYKSRKEGKNDPEGETKTIPSASERLKIARQFMGKAPFPDTVVSKYDWYEQ